MRGRGGSDGGEYLTTPHLYVCSPAHDGSVVHESAGEVATGGDSGDSACEEHGRKVVTHLARVVSCIVRVALPGRRCEEREVCACGRGGGVSPLFAAPSVRTPGTRSAG